MEGTALFLHLLHVQAPTQKTRMSLPLVARTEWVPWERKAWAQITLRDGRWREGKKSGQAEHRGSDSGNPLEPVALDGGKLLSAPMRKSVWIRTQEAPRRQDPNCSVGDGGYQGQRHRRRPQIGSSTGAHCHCSAGGRVGRRRTDTAMDGFCSDGDVVGEVHTE